MDGSEYTTELKMSGCQEGSFTCNDGQCVSMEQRCDQLPDCRDKSDEENCHVVVLERSYNKNVPPIITKTEKLNVAISLDILKLVDIKEKDYSIEIQFSIILEWKENRATYRNLKRNTSLNALTSRDIAQLWLPKVIYDNTDQKDTTRLGSTWEWETRIVVDRQGSFTRSKLDVVDEIELFNSTENSLLMTQTYTREFQCLYDFSMYPFDTQVRVGLFEVYDELDHAKLCEIHRKSVFFVHFAAKLYFASCLDGVWINPNKSHDSLDRSKLRPSRTLTNHHSNFFDISILLYQT